MVLIKNRALTRLLPFLFCCLLVVGSISISCTRRGGGSNQGIVDNPQVEQPVAPPKVAKLPGAPAAEHPVINVFIENSGSMNGFINNASEFQDAIQKMMVLLKHHFGSEYIKLNYINTAVHPQQVPANVAVEDFAIRMLRPDKFKGTGNVHSTDLNDIVKMILNGVDDNSISILVSDCIYSIVGSGTTITLLTGCKNKTMGAFLEKTREYPDLATTIVRLSSHFSGYYWDYLHPSGRASQTLDCDRPYYMCVIGTDANLNSFNEHINVDEMRGYQDKYVLSCSDFSNCNYSALMSSHRMAMYKVSGSLPYKTLERARSHGGHFQFSIAADLSSLPMSSTEKLDVNNYDIIQGTYEVVGVYEVDPIHMHPTDRKVVQDYNLTHEIVVSTSQYPADVIVGVKRDIPQWVKNVSSTDDTSINDSDDEKKKTFGLEYFVTGISDAYKEASPNKDYSTQFTIQVKH